MAWLKEESFKTKIVSTREMTQASIAELKNKKNDGAGHAQNRCAGREEE